MVSIVHDTMAGKLEITLYRDCLNFFFTKPSGQQYQFQQRASTSEVLASLVTEPTLEFVGERVITRFEDNCINVISMRPWSDLPPMDPVLEKVAFFETQIELLAARVLKLESDAK
jgi:hypothetical protein